jgi:glycosyltransferase involved in cell wall biosynthesis
MKILQIGIGAKNVPATISTDGETVSVHTRQLMEGLRQLGVEVDVLPVAGMYSRWNYLKAGLQVFKLWLTGGLKQYDLIHAHYGYNGVVARCQVGKPVIVTLMGSDVYRKSERAIARVLIRMVAGVIVPGAQQRALIADFPAEVIPYGTDLDMFRPMDKLEMRAKHNLPLDKKLVLFPYDPARVYHKRPDVIKAAVDMIEDAEWVVVFGKPPATIAEYMNACDVLAMASMYEGSPATIRESLACNLPVVSVDVADVKDHIADVPGCYICERTPEDMAARLRLVFADGKRLETGRQRVLHLGLVEVARETLAFYKKILKQV